MTSKRQAERLPALYLEPEPLVMAALRERVPGQPGYPQARAIERLRHKHVTRIRKLSRR
ncbi:hypothetical protein GTP41_02135 [Pseudoduganella sp. DS3]|uniref:Uncharacterized protein n=1 Tax=Pseudoduganella guangdongensis TaxID=2692179 RepID=A0A6N9HBP2_9BURK|nr:hypothetical protein [Pseudoduganella guangdongensis]MYN00889.1 hypothetical protein [Pseudoduganella guangdongensis]